MNTPRYLVGSEMQRFIASRFCPDWIRANPEWYEVLYLGGTDFLWCYTDEHYRAVLSEFSHNLNTKHVTTLSERTGQKGRKTRR